MPKRPKLSRHFSGEEKALARIVLIRILLHFILD